MVYAREDMMRSTIHPIVSWSHGMGLKKESLFIGTRDYSALLSSAAAIKYLQGSAKGIETRNRDSVLRYSKMLREAWGKSHSPFPLFLPQTKNIVVVITGTEKAQPDESVCGVTMVQLPHDLVVNDIPGTPEAGVRDLLRDTFGVEAALGNFKEHGNYVRLSCCSAYVMFERENISSLSITQSTHSYHLHHSNVTSRIRLECYELEHRYNTDRDYEKLRDAILDVLESQQRESATTSTKNNEQNIF